MTLTAKLKSPGRTIAVAIVIVALAAGVAFALLQVWGIIMGNSISTANAGLVVSTDGIHYGPAVTGGLSFSNLIPGGYPAPAGGYTVYLKNSGHTDLDLSFTLSDPPSDTDPDDLNSLNVLLADVSSSASPSSFSLNSLTGGNKQPMEGDLAPGETREYKLQVQATDDAQPEVTINNVNLAFVGTARDPNKPN